MPGKDDETMAAALAAVLMFGLGCAAYYHMSYKEITYKDFINLYLSKVGICHGGHGKTVSLLAIRQIQ